MNAIPVHQLQLMAKDFGSLPAGVAKTIERRNTLVDQLGMLPSNHVTFYAYLPDEFSRSLYLSILAAHNL